MAADFKISRRANKRRVLPNSRELVTKWNSQTPPDIISRHNDPMQIDWTELPPNPRQAPDYFVGNAALRIPEQSRPRYKLSWPIRYGWMNERDYGSRSTLERDLFLILEETIKNELGLKHKKDWPQYSCVFIIPDIYEKVFVSRILEELMHDFAFHRICFIQESLAASFGAGYGTGCIVDIGAQKTSVCCVEDGMCIEDSRINLKYGGYDVTEAFVKMMLFDRFHYKEFNLMRRHDFLLAEELKAQFTTLSDENVTVQMNEFHLRAHEEETRKYSFKIYDEGMLAPMGFFRPTIFDHSDKLIGRRTLIPRSVDLYNGHPNDPTPIAQMAVVAYTDKNVPSAVMAAPSKPIRILGTPLQPTSHKQRPLSIPAHLNGEEGTPRSSVAGSPPPEDEAAQQTNGDTNAEDGAADIHGAQPDTEAMDRTVPIMPLDHAILTSISHASGNDERRHRELLGSIMLIGGGSKIHHLTPYLETRLRASLPAHAQQILVASPPRELDPAVIVWKGGSVFGKLRMTNDSWIGQLEYDRLGSRILNYKCMWHWSFITKDRLRTLSHSVHLKKVMRIVQAIATRISGSVIPEEQQRIDTGISSPSLGLTQAEHVDVRMAHIHRASAQLESWRA
nr:putative actin-related protein 8 [Quercus suber]